MAEQYKPTELETQMLDFWEKHGIWKKASAKNSGKKKFYFIDGPPYTSGAIHIGTAWNKALKDLILRYKRMNGFDAWSQPGFDMHGLPIEVAVEKKLGIRDKREIMEKWGVRKFIDECEKFSIEQMHPMIREFSRMGVWMDWDNPYMTIKNEYIEGAWWALAEASRNGYLYEGKKSMTWCPRCATALAKHELEYKDVNDTSIYVKLPVAGKEKTFLIIWTTTPWTLPFNLAVMAHPEFEYAKARVTARNETWILAKALVKEVMALCGYQYEISGELKGIDLKGMKYHALFDDIPFQQEANKEHEAAHTVVMSTEYVELTAGTGLVHTAPGCGPEDFEVGRKNGLPPYNTVDEHGRFTQSGKYDGLKARNDDEKFTNAVESKGLLAAKAQVTHEYAHCWRCETPVIFRATEQWFLAVEKLKDEMARQNGHTLWVPDWAGNRWFDSWLRSLQDWCISRQRFWGIPLPIWRCAGCRETRVIASRNELPAMIENLHRPFIDEVKLKCKCDSEMSRVPDVLDVWLDSGAASWAPLGYPTEKDKFQHLWPADFILEGKDQIRGWFNSLTCLSAVSQRKNCYKAVYMHGFVNDALGRKMSKSLKNTISPYEVIDTYGADTLRYYIIGGANPGYDLNYNFEDMKLKNKNLMVYWNIHNFILELAETAQSGGDKELSIEEEYIISKMNSSIKRITYMFENYYLNETPWINEELLLELSRTYIQFTREKATGSDDERNAVLDTTLAVFLAGLKMLAPIAPFITEAMYQNLRKSFNLGEESIHLCAWPEADESRINEKLEKDFETAKNAVQAILAAREKAKMGIRWPLKEAVLVTTELEQGPITEAIARQANVKEIKVAGKFAGAKTSVQADYAKLLPKHGQLATRIVAAFAMSSPETVLKYIERDGEYALSLDSQKVMITQDDLIISKEAYGYEYAKFDRGEAYLNIISSPELEAEGYAREVTRRIQNMRKEAGLKRHQHISLFIKSRELAQVLRTQEHAIREKVGAGTAAITETATTHHYQHSRKEKIREKEIEISFDVI